MKLTKRWAVGVSVCVGAAGVAFAPAAAKAGCCEGAWGAYKYHLGSGTCTVSSSQGTANGGVGIYGIEGSAAYVYMVTSSSGSVGSPQIRHQSKCVNLPYWNMSAWTDFSAVAGAGYYYCDAPGVDWTRCQTRIIDSDWICGGSCS